MRERRVFLPRWARTALFAAALALPRLGYAVSLSVSPSSVATNYLGVLTLTISGVPSAADARVEMFFDSNGNGAVDSGEMLALSFEVTDGQAASISGIRNRNVPGDEDGMVNGAIRTEITVRALPELVRFASKWVLRVSPMSGGFAATTAAFTTTQPTYPQKVEGKVRSGGSAAGGAYVFIIGQNGGPVVGTITDGNGNFTLNSPNGTYSVVAAKPGFVADLDAAPTVTIGAGATVTQDLSLLAADRSISGRVADMGGFNGLAGVQIVAQADDAGLFTIGFTDADGYFSLSTSSQANRWRVDPSYRAAALLGRVSLSDGVSVDTAGGNVSNLSITWPLAVALIYGSLKDEKGQGLPWLDINPFSDTYASLGVTDSGGNYVVGVNLGVWSVGGDSDQLGPLGLSVDNQQVTIATGGAVRQDLVARRFSAHLKGRVTDDGGQPVGNICLFATEGSGDEESSTDANGNFDIGLFAGSWSLRLCEEEAQQRGLVAPRLHFEVSDGVDITNIEYVAKRATAHIRGVVKSSTDVRLADVFVFAVTSVGASEFDSSQRSGTAGGYSVGVFNGTWQVQLGCDDLRSRGYECPTSQSVTVGGGDVVLDLIVQPLGPLVITTASTLPDANYGAAYEQQLNASGGLPPYYWQITSNRLPYGMGLLGSGRIAGAPTEAGTFNFTVNVADNGGRVASMTFTLFVRTTPLQIDTLMLRDYRVGDMAFFALQASGGVPFYQWTLAPGSSALPPGLSLSSDGVLYGTLTTPGSFTFSLRVTDTAQSSVDRAFSITVSPALPTATPTRTPTGPSPTPTATPKPCLGDCSGDGVVHIEELVRGVNLVVSVATPLACPRFDCRREGGASMSCLAQGVGSALHGCAD